MIKYPRQEIIKNSSVPLSDKSTVDLCNQRLLVFRQSLKEQLTLTDGSDNIKMVKMKLKPKHPGRVSEKALDYLREVVEYGFGNASGPGMIAREHNLAVIEDNAQCFLGGVFPVDSDIYKGQYRDYSPGLCPVAESIQPKLMQFKTNYMDLNEAERQAEILRKTIESFGKLKSHVKKKGKVK